MIPEVLLSKAIPEICGKCGQSSEFGSHYPGGFECEACVAKVKAAQNALFQKKAQHPMFMPGSSEPIPGTTYPGAGGPAKPPPPPPKAPPTGGAPEKGPGKGKGKPKKEDPTKVEYKPTLERPKKFLEGIPPAELKAVKEAPKIIEDVIKELRDDVQALKDFAARMAPMKAELEKIETEVKEEIGHAAILQRMGMNSAKVSELLEAAGSTEKKLMRIAENFVGLQKDIKKKDVSIEDAVALAIQKAQDLTNSHIGDTLRSILPKALKDLADAMPTEKSKTTVVDFPAADWQFGEDRPKKPEASLSARLIRVAQLIQHLANDFTVPPQDYMSKKAINYRESWAEISDAMDALVSPFIEFLEAVSDLEEMSNEIAQMVAEAPEEPAEEPVEEEEVSAEEETSEEEVPAEEELALAAKKKE